jgi:hypothetical protein
MRLYILALGLYQQSDPQPELIIEAESEEEFLSLSLYWLFPDSPWNPQPNNPKYHGAGGKANLHRDRCEWLSLIRLLLQRPTQQTYHGYGRREVRKGELGASEAFGWECRGEIEREELAVIRKFKLRGLLPA